MAPGTDAVGLINGQPDEFPLLVNLLQQAPGGLHLEPFGRQIKQAQAIATHPLQQVPPAHGI